MKRLATRYRHCAILFALVISLLAQPGLALAAAPVAPLADDEVWYPDFWFETRDGLEIGYAIDGVSIDRQSDGGAKYTRSLSGTITGKAIAVLAVGNDATPSLTPSDDEFVLTVSVKAGDQQDSKTHSSQNDFFDQYRKRATINVPANASSADVSIVLKAFRAGKEAGLLQVFGHFTRAEGPLTVKADPPSLPADGKSQSRVVFTYTEGGRPVAGKNIDLERTPGKDGAPSNKASLTTNDQGQVGTSVTAPSPEEAIKEVKVVAKVVGGTAQAQVVIPIAGLQGTLTVKADPASLPADGKSLSRVVFTYGEGGKPVAGKKIDLERTPGKDGAPSNKASLTTNDQGQVGTSVTAPAPEEAVKEIKVVAKVVGGTAQAQVVIPIVSLLLSDVGLYAAPEGGGDHILLNAQLKNPAPVELKDLTVSYYEGKSVESGKLIGSQNLRRLLSGEAHWVADVTSTLQDVPGMVKWQVGGKAENKPLLIAVTTPSSKTPIFSRALTVNSYGAPFALNRDAYSFNNPDTTSKTVEQVEDALAIFLASEYLSAGLHVLSAAKLIQEIAQYEKDFGSGHCLGMSVSAASYFNQPSTRPSPGPTFAYRWNDRTVQALIVLQQWQWFSARFQQAFPLGQSVLDPTSFNDLRDRIANEFGAGRVVAMRLQAADDSYAHEVLPFQMVGIPEIDLVRLMLYDSNNPYSGESATQASKAATMRVAQGTFQYVGSKYEYRKVGLDPILPISAKDANVFMQLARELAAEQTQELLASGQRLVTFRGPMEPLFVTPDGKRLGFRQGKKIAEIPNGNVAKMQGLYVFKLPKELEVSVDTSMEEDGTISVGVATPGGKGSTAPARINGLASPLRDVAAEISTVLFNRIAGSKGAALRLAAKGITVQLSVAGKAVTPTSHQTVDKTTFPVSTGQSSPPAQVRKPAMFGGGAISGMTGGLVTGTSALAAPAATRSPAYTDPTSWTDETTDGDDGDLPYVWGGMAVVVVAGMVVVRRLRRHPAPAAKSAPGANGKSARRPRRPKRAPTARSRRAEPAPADAPADCPRCGKPVEPGAGFCVHCGAEASAAPAEPGGAAPGDVPKACGRCGAPRGAGDDFCPGCGARYADG